MRILRYAILLLSVLTLQAKPTEHIFFVRDADGWKLDRTDRLRQIDEPVHIVSIRAEVISGTKVIVVVAAGCLPRGGRRSMPKSWPSLLRLNQERPVRAKRADRQKVIAIYARSPKILLL